VIRLSGVGAGVKNLYVAYINIYSSPVGTSEHESESLFPQDNINLLFTYFSGVNMADE
jgi:hypothetical protein